jgi:tetratricopeptide (TPR) repeat protein
MSKEDWYRRKTWTEADRMEFDARLKRSRGSGNKAQYLRIQALYLADAGHDESAIELLDRMFAEIPDRIDLTQAHYQKAVSLAKLEHTNAALAEYRAALQAERNYPRVKTNAWLSFGWFVIEKQLTEFYGVVLEVLKEFRDERRNQFPASEYRYAVIQSLLADARGEQAVAKEFAIKAITEAAKGHSGFQYHPSIGLVGSERVQFEDRLNALAGIVR